MKLSSKSLILISVIIGLVLESGINIQGTPVYLTQDTITGSWLGELEIPNNAKLRMGITVSRTTGIAYKAALKHY